MSYNRLGYDTCAYDKKLQESTGTLEYVLNPMKYENCKKCRHGLGIVAGNDVSIIRGNMVDLENDLRGQTRAQSLCPGKKYLGPQPGVVSYPGLCPQAGRTVDTTPVHLPTCQFFELPQSALPKPFVMPKCQN